MISRSVRPHTGHDLRLPRPHSRGSKPQSRHLPRHVLLIVNVASRCDFTPQYAALEQLYQRYKDRGFVVLGFPCNQFGTQEPGTDSDIQSFCALNYGVTFPVLAKGNAKGAHADPLFQWLTAISCGWFGARQIKWNFTKFLIDRQGRVAQRFAPHIGPQRLATPIAHLL